MPHIPYGEHIASGEPMPDRIWADGDHIWFPDDQSEPGVYAEYVRADKPPERIVAAAVRACGATWSLPRPARHHNVLRAIVDAGLEHPGPGDQGFLTSDGRFVGRREGARIAIDAGQIEQTQWGSDLFSEDLW